jgi:hypothetical protein
VTSRCIASRELELATLSCIVDGMDLYTESYFKDALTLPGNSQDSAFFSAFVDHFTSRDCRNNLGHQTSLRESELFVVIDSKCADSVGCDSDACLDTTCTITGTKCFLECQMFWAEKGEESLFLFLIFILILHQFSPHYRRMHERTLSRAEEV